MATRLGSIEGTREKNTPLWVMYRFEGGNLIPLPRRWFRGNPPPYKIELQLLDLQEEEPKHGKAAKG